jgi:hypothetical protein
MSEERTWNLRLLRLLFPVFAVHVVASTVAFVRDDGRLFALSGMVFIAFTGVISSTPSLLHLAEAIGRRESTSAVVRRTVGATLRLLFVALVGVLLAGHWWPLLFPPLVVCVVAVVARSKTGVSSDRAV